MSIFDVICEIHSWTSLRNLFPMSERQINVAAHSTVRQQYLCMHYRTFCTKGLVEYISDPWNVLKGSMLFTRRLCNPVLCNHITLLTHAMYGVMQRQYRCY